MRITKKQVWNFLNECGYIGYAPKPHGNEKSGYCWFEWNDLVRVLHKFINEKIESQAKK